MTLSPPKLQVVPRSERLTYKVSMDGALMLKQGRFMKRYTGNKHVEIDINGKIWLNPGKLAAEIKSAKKIDVTKKKTPVETGVVNKFTNDNPQISDNLSTQQTELLTDIDELSPKPPKKYTVNKKEVPRRIMAMLNSQMGYRELYFITVSFPPVITDLLGMQLLNTWLTSLRKYRMIRQYLWVAERQPKTNTIHFHICVPHYFNVYKANRMMGGCLKELHKKGSVNFPGYTKYNGVDIAGTRPGGKGTKKYITNFAEKKGGKALGWYLTKYVTKNNAEFDNYAWHNSRGYSALHHGITLTDAEFIDGLGYVDALDNNKIFEREWFAWAPWARGAPASIQLELFRVNSYTQFLLEYFHPKDDGALSYTDFNKLPEQTAYYNNILKFKEMRHENNPTSMQTEEATSRIVNNERRMLKAFLLFAGEEDFNKEFSNKMRLTIKERVSYIGMETEFKNLIALIDSEHEGPGFFYTYHLYCYWAIDLLNQIPNN